MRAQLLGPGHGQVTVINITKKKNKQHLKNLFINHMISSSEPSIQNQSQVDFDALLVHFLAVQKRHK